MSFGRIPVLREGLRLSLAVRDGRGPPAIWQHGLCGDAAQTMALAPEGVAVRTLECRGHGASDAGDPARYALATFADDVAAVAEAGPVPLWVGGVSMGAALALRLAVRRPDLVPALVLARPAWATGAAPSNMAPNAEVGRLLAGPPRPGEAQAFRDGATGRRLAASAPANLASLCGFFDRAPRDVTAALLRAIPADGPGVSAEDLGRLAVPCLVIGADDDDIHPLALARTLAAAIPGARLVEVTPKGRDPVAHGAEIRRALHAFTETLR